MSGFCIPATIIQMEVSLGPGKYVLAVSGGVDSVVLLDVLRQKPRVELVVGHYDHGMRTDSAEDRQLVQKIAEECHLPFEYEEGTLGAGASEAAGRTARYEFFERMRRKYNAAAIITAHHQDDVLETAILNLLRGTGRKGLTALASTDKFVRPLLKIPKADILVYAKNHQLTWREDSTNSDEKYLRNYIRRKILPRFDEASRQQLLSFVEAMRPINDEIDQLLADVLAAQGAQHALDRQWFIGLPHALSKETMAAWLRANDLANFDTRTLERLTIAAKTARPGSSQDVRAGAALRIQTHHIVLESPKRS